MRFRVALAAAAVLLVPAAARAACSCLEGHPRQLRDASTAVFVGRVLDFAGLPVRQDVGGGRVREWTYYVARLVVTRGLKGARAGDTVAVGTPGSSCLVWFSADSAYLVYASARSAKDASGARPALETEYCMGTKPLRCAAPDLAAFGEAPEPGAADCRRPAPRAPAPPGTPPGAPPNVALRLPRCSRTGVVAPAGIPVESFVGVPAGPSQLNSGVSPQRSSHGEWVSTSGFRSAS